MRKDNPKIKAYNNARLPSRLRGRQFLLTREQYYNLTMQPCAYCGGIDLRGDPPTPCNGVDRVDNNIGYIESNCKSCCKMCNRAKNNMHVNSFFRWIDFLVAHRLKNMLDKIRQTVENT